MGRNLLSKNERKRDEILHRRAIVREAFDKIRRDPAKQETVNLFAKALGGKIHTSPIIIDLAHKELDT